MIDIKIPHNFTPRPYQEEFFRAMDSGKKRALLRWHRRAGKDAACFAYMIKRAVAEPGNYYYIFPESAQGRRSLWETTDSNGNSALDYIPKELEPNINSQEMRITMPTLTGQRSIIRVIGLDKNVDKIRGVACAGAVCSEFAYQDPEAYKTLMPSIREKKGWIIFNSTPQGKNHMWDMEHDNKDNPNWYINHIQTTDEHGPGYTGIFKPEELIEVQAEEDYTNEQMEREYGASYSAGTQGAIYVDHIDKAREEGRVGIYPYDSNYPVHTFWDLGYNDPTAIWYVQYIDRQIRFIDYWQQAKLDIPDIVTQALLSKDYKYAEHVLPHDANNKYGLIVTKKEMLSQALKANNLTSRVSVAPKQPLHLGIEAVQARFSKYVFNIGTCNEALDMLALYHKRWDSKRKVYIKEPVHDWTSHCADAIRTEATQVSDVMYRIPSKPVIMDNDYDILT